jgi:hypothetical protein
MTLVIPDELLQSAQLTVTQLRQEIAQWLWQKHYATLEQASQLAQTNPLEFQQLTAHHPHQNDTSVPVNVNLGKLANLKPRNYIIGDPEDLVHIDWSKEWKEWPE